MEVSYLRAETKMNINEIVNLSLERWVDLIGYKGKVKGPRLIGASVKAPPGFDARTLEETVDMLNESRELDKSGLTTFMMLRGMVEWYLQNYKFSAYNLLLDPAPIAVELKRMKAIRESVEHPEVVEIIRDFQGKLKAAALQYKVRSGREMDALESLIQDKYDLGMIRRDALRTIERMEAHQFTQGATDPIETVKFSPQVYEFWNVNSLLSAMRGQKVSGITMCLIRDPDEMFASYFIFAIRNGANLTILTDREKVPHPEFHRMARRPDRDLERRAARNWFPYHLLGFKEKTEDQPRLRFKERNQLVPMNTEAVTLKDIRDLGPEEFVWATLMFDLIREKFWVEKVKLPELSYTGEMVVEPHALVGATSGLVKDGAYTPLFMPPLTKADMTNEVLEKQWAQPPRHHNAWMTERYGPEVPDEVLSPVGEEAAKLLAATHYPGDVRIGVFETKPKMLESLSPTNFGTKDDLQRDRLWAARRNQMKIIQDKAQADFEANREKVEKWYRDKITSNCKFIIDACAKGSLPLPWSRVERMGDHWNEGVKLGEKTTESLKMGVGKYYHKAFEYLGSAPKFRLGSWEMYSGEAYCAERTDTKATVFFIISPRSPEALAILAGVKKEELPWGLQHWILDEPYHGNSILNRLDPEDWALKNPWIPENRGIDCRVMVALCKGAFHARRKSLGLPRKELEDG